MGANCAQPAPPSPSGEKRYCHTGEHEFSDRGCNGHAIFEIELDHGWASFDPMTARMLADAFLNGHDEIEYSARRQMYVVDFHKMLQVNVKTGRSRRMRRIADKSHADINFVPVATHTPAEEMPPLHADYDGQTGSSRIPPIPASFPDLSQLGDSELARLKGSPSAIEEFILGLPQARVIQSSTSDAKVENAKLVKAVAGKLAAAAQRADSEGETCLQDTLALEGVMDNATLASFKERFLQAKTVKHRRLLTKKQLESGGEDWDALISMPATTRVGF